MEILATLFFIFIFHLKKSQAQHVELVCPDIAKTLNLTIKCKIKLVSLSETDHGEINFTDSTRFSFNTASSQVLSQSFADVNKTSTFLLLNSFIKENTTLNGFEIATENNGSVKLSVFKTNVCVLDQNCLNSLVNSGKLPNYSVIKNWTINLISGIANYSINTSFQLEKGMIFLLDQTLTGKVMVTKSDFISDYQIDTNNNLIDISNSGSKKFSIVPITTSLYKKESFYQIEKSFKTYGVYNVSVLIGNIGNTISINLIDLKSFELTCNQLMDSEAKCSVVYYSTSIENKIFINNQNYALA